MTATTSPKYLLNTCDVHSYTSLSVTTDANLQAENGKMFFLEDKPSLGIDINPDILGVPDIIIDK